MLRASRAPRSSISQAVLIPLFIWFANRVEAHYASASQRQEYVQNLDLEIAYRVNCVVASEKDQEASTLLAKLEVSRQFLLPTFEGMPTSSLMFQLERAVPAAEATEIKKARLAVTTTDGSREDLRIREWLPKDER